MDSVEFVELADSWLKDSRMNRGESLNRTIVNRSYLGTLLKISEIIEPQRTTSYSDSSDFYSEVEDDLRRFGVSGASDKLTTLRHYRKQADYDLDSDLEDWMPEKSVKLARHLMKIVSDKF